MNADLEEIDFRIKNCILEGEKRRLSNEKRENITAEVVPKIIGTQPNRGDIFKQIS